MPGQFGNYGGGGGGGGGGGRRGPRTIITDPEHEQFRKLFIGGLSYDTTEDTLRTHFEQWGEIVDCVVMKDPQSKRSRGFGFITYDKAHMIQEAQDNRPHKIDGREVETKRAMPREESSNSESQVSVKKMFVGGLKEGTSEEQIRECFKEFGEMEKVDLISDKNSGRNRGFCFVTFKDYDSVDQCVLKKRFQLNEKDVEVKKAVSKSDQQGGGRGMGGGGRGGMRGGGGNNWNQGGGNFGGGFNQGFGGGGGGGYNDGGFGGNQGGYGGGGYGGGGGGYGGGGGGFSGGGGGGYNNQGGGGGWSGQNFGSNYGDNYGGGAMKGGGYNQRGPGPYGGGGYGGGGYGGGGGGGGYGGGNRR